MWWDCLDDRAQHSAGAIETGEDLGERWIHGAILFQTDPRSSQLAVRP
jgi:hypothetical protein